MGTLKSRDRLRCRAHKRPTHYWSRLVQLRANHATELSRCGSINFRWRSGMRPELPNFGWDTRTFIDIPPARPVISYGFRTYRHGDEGAWLDTLASGDSAWDRSRLDQMLAGERAPVPLEGVVFATSDDVPIGAANLFLYERADGPYSELGWVAVRPEHRGRGLAYEVCRRGLLFANFLKHRYTYLTTQDFRLSAIKTYLRLGFEPEIIDRSHCARWNVLRRITAVG